MDKLTKAFSADVSVNDGERAVTAKISTITVDREGDVLMPSGCLTRDYKKNPVVFFAHNYYTLPVGKCTGMKIEDDGITAKTVFAMRPVDHPMDKEWLPDTLFALFQQGVLKGFSVGINPIEIRGAVDSDMRRYGDGCRRVVQKWALLEYSVAPLPANQEAIATAVSKGIVAPDAAKQIWGIESAPAPAPVVSKQFARRILRIVREETAPVPKRIKTIDPAEVFEMTKAKMQGRVYFIQRTNS